MGHNNGIISTSDSGISVLADIAEVLGVVSGDVGTLCRSNNVNMWAKYKPIKYMSWITNGGGRVDSDGNPYGICRPSHDDISQIASSQIYWVKPTGYAIRTGEVLDPFRVLDFDGYNHNCVCPWTLQMPSGDYLPKWTETSTMIVKFLDKGGLLPTNNVSIADLYPGMYFCVFINGYYKTLGSGASSLNISGCPAYRYAQVGSTLTIMCAMCSEQIGDPTDYEDWQNGGVDAMFYSLACPESTTVRTYTIYKAPTPEDGYYFSFELLGDLKDNSSDRSKISLNRTYVWNNSTLSNTVTQNGRLSTNYEATAAVVKAFLHSDRQHSTVIEQQALSVEVTNPDIQPLLLERGDSSGVNTYTMSAVINIPAMHLPIPQYGDSYDIVVQFTYDLL